MGITKTEKKILHSEISDTVHWYALYIKSRHEKKVAGQLDDQGFEIYCPLTKRSHQWSDRIKVVTEPVFRGYLFIRGNRKQLWESLQNPGVVAPVRYLGKPAVIRDVEIENIRKFLNEFPDAMVEQLIIEPHDRVKVRRGVMMDYKGVVLEVFGNVAVVRLESLGLSLTAQFEKKNLEKI